MFVIYHRKCHFLKAWFQLDLLSSGNGLELLIDVLYGRPEIGTFGPALLHQHNVLRLGCLR